MSRNLPMKKSSCCSSKHQYEKALRDIGYTDFELSLIKSVPTKQKDIGSVTLFGLIHLSAEQSPQMLEKGFSNYYVTTSHAPTGFTKYLIKTQWKWATVAPKM